MKYYKITNLRENHWGMQYKDGENIDILPFNPSGDCEPGGIYFAREDILFFLDYGVWLREVIIPEGEEVYENPDDPKKWKAHRIILGKREWITGKTIQRLIEEGANNRMCLLEAMTSAITMNDLRLVKFMVKYIVGNKNEDRIKMIGLEHAIEFERIDIAKYLIDNGAKITGYSGKYMCDELRNYVITKRGESYAWD